MIRIIKAINIAASATFGGMVGYVVGDRVVYHAQKKVVERIQKEEEEKLNNLVFFEGEWLTPEQYAKEVEAKADAEDLEAAKKDRDAKLHNGTLTKDATGEPKSEPVEYHRVVTREEKINGIDFDPSTQYVTSITSDDGKTVTVIKELDKDGLPSEEPTSFEPMTLEEAKQLYSKTRRYLANDMAYEDIYVGEEYRDKYIIAMIRLIENDVYLDTSDDEVFEILIKLHDTLWFANDANKEAFESAMEYREQHQETLNNILDIYPTLLEIVVDVAIRESGNEVDGAEFSTNDNFNNYILDFADNFDATRYAFDHLSSEELGEFLFSNALDDTEDDATEE